MTDLYHYCSNASFHSIIENKSIRLCSLTLSNDSLEGKLVADIISRVAKDDGMDAAEIQRLEQHVKGLEKILDGLGFCLSEDGDLLSQWRGYADDAAGVSIGFNKDSLNSLSESSTSGDKSGFTLQRVEYDQSAQAELVRPTYLEIKKAINNGAFKMPGPRGLLDTRSEEDIEEENKSIKSIYSNFIMTVTLLLRELFLLKSKAFKEEREWRLISYFVKTGNEECLFHADGNRILPYREYSIGQADEDVISEIILGPKNLTPVYVIESFLRNNGFNNVKISRSDASYR